jgi:hypothetical protein
VSRDSCATVTPERRGEEKRGEERRGDRKSLKTLAPVGATVKGAWKVDDRKALANAVVVGNEKERNGNRMARGTSKALYSNAMKIVRIIEDLEVTPTEYLECVRYHASAVYGNTGVGYKQTWGSFAGSFDAIIGEVRRKDAVPAGKKNLTDGARKWLERKELESGQK